jgi:hypothetical protein
MQYFETRQLEQLIILDRDIAAFARRYRKGHPTIIFCPGGLASQLLRTTETHREDGGWKPRLKPTWVNIGLVVGTGRRLKMEGDRDADNHVIVASGAVEFSKRWGPYSRLRQWCDYHEFNYFVFGWDWRRNICHSVALLHETIITMRRRIHLIYSEDLIPNTILLAHCFGGLLVKLVLDAASDYVDSLRAAVTVSTPFYGYGGQLHRYFVGDTGLNRFYGAAEMAKIISSFESLYSLLFIDQDTYRAQADLLGLCTYPVLDAETGCPADPYNAVEHAHRFRYPTFKGGWFDTAKLHRARQIRQQIAAPLPDRVQAKFFNVAATCFPTPVSQIWDWIGVDFDPFGTSPVLDKLGPGDDTIPAWSARLASTDKDHSPLLGPISNHIFMMGHNEALESLQEIIAPQRPSMRGARIDEAIGRQGFLERLAL